MYKLLVLALLVCVCGCREKDSLAPYLGPYYGGFDTALSADPTDDLNPNECSQSDSPDQCQDMHVNPLSHLLMKLGQNADSQLTLGFYRSQAEYEAGEPMYLSDGCRTSLGPAQDYRLYTLDDDLDQTQVLASARFPLQFGNQILACTNSARFSSAAEPYMELSLQVNPVSGASAISITMERSRRDGNYLYVKKDGEKVAVKLDLRYAGRDGSESRRLCAADDATLLENKDGYEAVCVMTGRDEWSVVLPASPFGAGVTAFWGSTRSPKWYRTTDEPDVVTYHKAVFVPVELGTEDGQLAE